MRVADVTVNDYKNAVGGFGHIGVSVDNDPSVGFYPKTTKDPGTQAEEGLGVGVPGQVKRDDSSELGKATPHTIHTAPAQDAAMRRAISERKVNPGTYYFYVRNCKDFVRSVLQSGGIKTNDALIPNNWFDENFKGASK